MSAPPSTSERRLRLAGRAFVALVALVVVIGTGAAWRGYHDVVAGVTTSGALGDAPKSDGKDQNILIMGLDSRLDEQGKPLPQDMYDALHAGDDSVGGYNSNVLILIHIPGDGSKATGISIPRDDYVQLATAACAQAPCKGKIKQAYGLAYDLAKTKLEAAGVKDLDLEQQAREVGRKAEIDTVRAFLGGVTVDHFVEVTLVAFFQLAQVVQPITVCLNENTSDNFSGADFHKGKQDIDASQAMAFVRQRRDPDPDLNFTDLDRTRRQQAFIVSLMHSLQSSGAMSNPSRLRDLLNVAKQNIAIDDKLDLASFAQHASALTSGGISLFTLPVKDFGTDDAGEDINIVDVSEIRAIAHNLLSGSGSGTTTSTTTTSATPTNIAAAAGVTLNVVNSTGTTGLAARVADSFTALGFTRGTVETGANLSNSTITYGRGADAAASGLADKLGITATKSTSVDSGTVQLTIGTDLTSSGPIADLAKSTDDSTTATTTTVPPPPPVSATATGSKAPAPTDLSNMDADGIPCVK
ncbi:LCP family protein [Nocardia sp. NBC_01327]|uniref:LCP family protein n=1 Tax=Nocardia sp. NBC_01327 TaxID=2903593 RepID=UPI002E11B04F|nr:LCP family protein [Nocardia sp. NBC_01327]